MLRSLEIRDILIIDRLELGFQPGLNVLTGETGAGKSILLDSLGFVLGWRGRAELVRKGAAQGEVVAEFDIAADHPAHAVLEEAGLADDGALLLRRVNTAEGRKTAWVNDRRVSGDILRRLSDCLLELHGQQDDKGLLNPRAHRKLLDAFAGLEVKISKTRKAWRNVADARKALVAAEEALAEMRAEEEFLRHALQEINTLDPQPGEEADLDAQRRMMQAADKVREDIAKASQALGLNGAEGPMGDAQRWLEDAAPDTNGALDDALAALDRARTELGEAQHGVSQVLDQLSFDPSALEHAEERLFAIRGLARKHNIQPDALAGFAEDLRKKAGMLDAGDDQIAELRKAANCAQAEYDRCAEVLTAARQKAAKQLDKRMATELAPLKMERAVFTTQVEPGDAGPEGVDAVTFSVATNPGAPAGALNKIASGGELSRFLLALKVCLTDGVSGLTMIFDEIDRGVGGATANAVGRRLAGLAEGGQVLVVTHSPQVAAQGAHHWRVAKEVKGGATLSRVIPVHGDDRVDEIARMLAGDTITEPARAAARALMDDAG